MSFDDKTLDGVAREILAAPQASKRKLVAISGAPASGKSTLASKLIPALAKHGCKAVVVPMDGFHLHNQILVDRGLLKRKGAPETFDVRGFSSLVSRLAQDQDVYFPEFHRGKDVAYAGAGCVDQTCETVIVEGNYLLLDSPIWRDLTQHWDYSIKLDVDPSKLKQRLSARWLEYGLSPEKAEQRAAENDLINAQLVLENSQTADLTL